MDAHNKPLFVDSELKYKITGVNLVKIFSMAEAEEVLDQDANDQEEQDSVVETPVVEAPKEAVKPVEEQKPQEERPTWTMPVAKAQEEKRKAVEKAREEAKAEADASIAALRAEMEGKLAEAKGTPTDDAMWKGISDKHGIDPEVTKDLFTAFKASMPQTDLSKYDQILKEREIDGYKLRVSQEFDEKVLPLIQKDFPGVTSAHIADVKSKVSDLAFSEGYNTYAIEDIYKVRRDDFEYKNGFSAEASGGRSSEMVDFSKMTDKEEHALAERDPAAYGNYLKAMRTNGSRFLD